MSTAGKVLVVLVTLSLMAWIVLFSAADQLNVNYGRKINAQEKTIEETKAKLEDALAQTEKFNGEAAHRQAQLNDELTVLRSRLSDAENALTASNETNTRYKLNLSGVQAHAEEAKAEVDRRDRFVADLKSQRAAVESVVRRFQGENRVLIAQFDKLQKDFLKTVDENKKLAQEARKGTIQRTSDH